MLKKILSSQDCASCRFCCSFRRQSLWETPLFTDEQKTALEAKYPEAKFKKSGEKSWTVELIHLYKTNDSEEEAPCPFLGSEGCICTPEEKPFDCSIWPLRACKTPAGKTAVMLENTCPAINKVPVEKVQSLVDEGLGKKILDEAEKNSDMIKPLLDGFKLL